MTLKPTYKELEKRIQEFDKKNSNNKKIKKALKESEERYREYFEENISGKYISSPEGRLIDCNNEFERIFGFNTKQEALDTPISDIIIDLEERGNFLNLLKKEKQIIHYRPKFKKIDGTPVHLIENSSGIFDKEGKLDHIRGFLLDVTEQKKLQDQLFQSQKMEAIGTLAGGIAHDFNNILSSIFGYAQLAKLQIAEPEKAEKSIDQLLNGAQRAAALIQQILTFSRQSEYKTRPFKVSALIKEVLKLLRSSIPTNIEINENIFSDATIMADSTQIHQVIMNLCTNAYHAMRDTGGTLTIDLNEVNFSDFKNTPDLIIQSGNYLKLSVRDTGHGIDEKILKQIFDPYFTTKEIGKGTGLGLAVVDGIVKNHNGFIKSYSKVGHGSMFEIFWPICEQKVSDSISQKNKADLVIGKEQIMLVDDEMDILDSWKMLLKQLGYKIKTFRDGSSALKAFTNNPNYFDLIITDMTMPKISGDKLSAEVLKIRKDMPIILCTGYNENITHDKAKKIGINKYLQKPVTAQMLTFSIREVMKRHSCSFASPLSDRN